MAADYITTMPCILLIRLCMSLAILPTLAMLMPDTFFAHVHKESCTAWYLLFTEWTLMTTMLLLIMALYSEAHYIYHQSKRFES